MFYFYFYFHPAKTLWYSVYIFLSFLRFLFATFIYLLFFWRVKSYVWSSLTHCFIQHFSDLNWNLFDSNKGLITFVVYSLSKSNQTNHGQTWIRQGGPVTLPPKITLWNPLHFCVWDHLKSKVYSIPINTVEELESSFVHAYQEFRNDPEVFERIRNSLQRRAQYCIQMQRRHFEHHFDR